MLNKVMLIGNLGADPEVRYMPSGDTVTTINLATSRRWRDRQTGEQREETEWHRVTFFNIGNYKLAEIAAEYLKKGSKAYVEGRLKTSKYQKNGQDQYSREIIADEMKMLDPRPNTGTAEFGQQGGYAAPQTNQNQNFQQQQQPQQFNQQSPQQQNFQQPQQAQQFNQPAPVAQQNFQDPPQMQQPFNQSTPPPVQQPPLQPPPVQVEQKPAFNDAAAIQSAPTEKPAPADDFDDDIPF